MTEKIYAGLGKNIKTQYGDLLKISFTKDDVQKLQDNLNNGWVNLVVKERREPSEKGTTHYLEIDQWSPNKDSANSTPTKQEEEEEMPF